MNAARAGAALAACAAFLWAGPFVSASPAGTPADEKGKSVAIVMDVSGSMARLRPGMQDWILRQTVLCARNGDRFRVLKIGRNSFGDALALPVLDIPRTGRLLPDRQIRFRRLQWWAALVRDSLARLPVESATDIGGALLQAARLLHEDGARFGERRIVMLTDLRDNRGLPLPAQAARLDGIRVLVAFISHEDGDAAGFIHRVGLWRERLLELGASEVRCLDVAESQTPDALLTDSFTSPKPEGRTR